MKYIAKPVVVDAYRITTVQSTGESGTVVGCEDAQLRVATPEMTSRMAPAVGDYWVIQSDGYEYLNPKAVFERKYEQDPLACGQQVPQIFETAAMARDVK